MADGNRASRKIIPFPGRRVDEKPAFPLRLAALVVAALLAGQAMQALQPTRRAPPPSTPDALDLPLVPLPPNR